MDTKLSAIIEKAAGTYFIVTDKSQVPAIEADPKMRLFFINSEKGAVNTLYTFARGNIAGFQNIFGKANRLTERRGNFSISTCIDALAAGPIAVINLRAFDNTLDITGILGLNPNILPEVTVDVPYTELFNTNKFWSPDAKQLPIKLVDDTYLSFATIGNTDISIIVVKSTKSDVDFLTAEGDKTLLETELEIDDYPGLAVNSLIKDSFVSVYLFNNSFNGADISTNKYYGQYFDVDGKLDLGNINTLANVPQSGFVKKFVGSLIPGLVSEIGNNISIDAVINAETLLFGLLSYLNTDLLEIAGTSIIDTNGLSFFDETYTRIEGASDYLLSHIIPAELTEGTPVVYPPSKAQNVFPAKANINLYGISKVTTTSFHASFEQGLRVGDYLKGVDGLVRIISAEVISQEPTSDATGTYSKTLYTLDGAMDNVLTGLTAGPVVVAPLTYVAKHNFTTEYGYVMPFDMSAYKPRSEQFTDGTAERQAEILDMMLSPGIVKGIKSTDSIRYVVDCFKSFVEPNYKSQFGQLMVALDEGNRFVRAIINEPFVEDLEKSVNPLMKESPISVFDWKYLPEGGNTTYSSKLLTKFSTGSNMCFFFGPGNKVNGMTKGGSGLVSNLFYLKRLPFDVLANETGYVEYTELETSIDDDDRAFCEKFRYNPIIFFNGGNTIFGNKTAQLAKTSLSQITNSELLAYVKQSLYNLSKSEAFKKGNYDDYLRTETESKNFMEGLSLAGAIQPNYSVVCDASNNTAEIAKQGIKLVHIEYTAINSLDKVVFDLTIK